MKGMPETTSRYDRDTFSVFRILPWTLDRTTRTVTLRYAFDDIHRFAEHVTLAASLPFGDDGAELAGHLAGVIDLLAVVAGVSYFKIGAPRRIEVDFALTAESLTMMRHVYDDGLREFAYRASLPIPLLTTIVAPTIISTGEIRSSRNTPLGATEILDRKSGVGVGASDVDPRPLLPMGGGRDSALLASMLAPFDPILTAHGDNRFIDRLGDALDTRIHRVQRIIDPLLFELNCGPALNGHVPVTAINSLIGVLTAVLVGATDVVMANERSASVASLTTDDGFAVNHQYSKSFDFEVLLGQAIASVGGPGYFSGLRPWNELAIAKAFAARPALHPAIMSCNRAFIRDPAKRSDGWCGHCDKCRFVWLTLTPFMEQSDLVEMFGCDLFDIPANLAGFAELLRDDQRPWDCVGEPSEARLALRLIAPTNPTAAGILRATRTSVDDTLLEQRLQQSLDDSLQPSTEDRIPEPYRSTIFGAMRAAVHS